MQENKKHSKRKRVTHKENSQAAGAELAIGQAKKRLGQIDLPLLTLVLVLLSFGLVMLYSASFPAGHLREKNSFFYVGSQLKYAVVGLVAMFGAALIDYRLLRKFAWPLMAVAVVLLIVVLFMPEMNFSRRWIWLPGGGSFQPSEIAKFAVILLFAALISRHKSKMNTFQYGFIPFILVLGIISYLLVREPHISCTILVLGIGVSMMFAGGTSLKWFGLAGIIGAVALFFTITLFPDLVYAQGRIQTWLDPINSTHSSAYQVLQGLIAVGSGGAFGLGIGRSVQKYLHLPEVYNDYIFAVLCEELGMIGAVVVILLFLLLLARGLYLAFKVEDTFGSMLMVGITIQIALQAFLHIGVNTNAIPSTGISMPFFSSGGSSLVMLLGQVGVMLSVSRSADFSKKKEQQDALPLSGQQLARQQE